MPAPDRAGGWEGGPISATPTTGGVASAQPHAGPVTEGHRVYSGPALCLYQGFSPFDPGRPGSRVVKWVGMLFWLTSVLLPGLGVFAHWRSGQVFSVADGRRWRTYQLARDRHNVGRCALRLPFRLLFFGCGLASLHGRAEAASYGQPPLTGLLKEEDQTHSPPRIIEVRGPTLEFHFRSLPTPCRSLARPGSPGLHVTAPRLTLGLALCPSDTLQCAVDQSILTQECVTLLEEAVGAPGSRAFFLAATLLETLLEWEQERRQDLPCADSRVTQESPLQLSLQHSLPVTRFQASVLELSDIVPACVPLDKEDWLDADISFLIRDRHVPLHKRDLFAAVRTWAHRPAGVLPARLLVYSDGSASSSSSANCAPGAWAISVWVEADLGMYLLGHATGLTQPPESHMHIGELDDSALTCELLGVSWGLAWVIERAAPFEVPVVSLFDCLAAGFGTFGRFKVVASRSSGTGELALFATYLRQLATRRVALSHGHVAGHGGDVGNELCDELAKHCRRLLPSTDQLILPTWPSRLFQHPLKAWSWMLGAPSGDMPTLFALETEAHRMQRFPRLPRAGPTLGFVAPPSSADPVEVRAVVMSFNVLSLYDPKGQGHAAAGQGMRVVAKREVIKRQLAHLEVLMLGLQETRLANTEILPDKHFTMLHSAAEPNGHHGVALWISKQVAYAAVRGKPLRVLPEHLTVTGRSPRHLLVQINAPFLTWTVLVAHAPSEPPAAPGAAAAFWNACTHGLSRRPKNSDVVVLADANARLGSLLSPQVSDLDPEAENLAGTSFHQFLADNDLWVPSTFASCHTGPSATWTSPSGHQHRLDYVAVPLAWPPDAVLSRVQIDFEALQAHPDHVPVVLTCSLLAAMPSEARQRGTFRRLAVRPTIPVHQAYLTQLAGFQDLQSMSWDRPVDDHYRELAQGWRAAGEAMQSSAVLTPTQTYIQPPTLFLVHVRRGLREYLRQEKLELDRRRLLLGFAAFLHARRQTVFTSQAIERYTAWDREMRVSIARVVSRIRHTGTELRTAVRADRAAYLAGLVRDVSLADLRDPKHLYRAVRRASPKASSRRRQAFTPLPAVEDDQGSFAPDRDGRQELWRGHFASLEGGERLAPGAYPEAFREQRQAVTAGPACFDLAVVPTLTTVEQNVLSLRRGKACGQDGLTAELLQLSAVASARALLPIFVKSILGVQEPVEFRGGALMPLAKKAAAAFSCSKFRAILLSSLPSKLLHKHLRTCLSPHFQPQALQAGALPGISTESVALAAQAFQSLSHVTGRGWALIFFDVRSAFYCVVRQLLLPVGDSDRALQELFHKLHLPPTSINELRTHLESLASVPRTGCSLHLQRVATDVLQGTWFRLDKDAVLTLTH